MDVDDADLLWYENELLELKIWDDDEKTNKRYQIKAISYDTADEYFQAECVMLTEKETVDERHQNRGDDGFSNMVGYRFTGPGYFNIESLKNMAKDYEREHALAVAKAKSKGGKQRKVRTKLPIRVETIRTTGLRRSARSLGSSTR